MSERERIRRDGESGYAGYENEAAAVAAWHRDVADEEVREALAEFARPETPLACELCLQPITYGALCRICDTENLGLYLENERRWSE